MKNTLLEWAKRHFGTFLLFGGVSAYVVASGMTGSCPTCSAFTSVIGLPSFIPSAQAADVSAPSKAAPSWELKDLDGKTVKSSDFDGKVVILDF